MSWWAWHMTWGFDWWGLITLGCWDLITLDKGVLCRPHALMFTGLAVSVFAFGFGDMFTGCVCAVQFGGAWLWWWLGGGCNRDKRLKRLLAKLSSYAGELRRAALVRTMRERLVPVPVPT